VGISNSRGAAIYGDKSARTLYASRAAALATDDTDALVAQLDKTLANCP